MGNQRKSGIILTYASQVIHILSGIIYTPIMLRLLGQNEYGLYQLAYSTTSYLAILSLGFSSAYIRFYMKSKDEDDIKRLNGMFFIIFSVITCICLIAGSALVINADTIFADGLTNYELSKCRVLMGIMVLNLALNFFVSPFDCFIIAHEKFLFQKTLILIQNLFTPLFTLPLLIIGYGSLGMVLVTTALLLTKIVLDIVFCSRKLKMQFAFKKLSWNLFKETGIFTFFIFINMVVDQINWSLDKFLLGRYTSTVAVAIYGVASNIQNLYAQLASAASNVFIPKINKMVVKDNNILAISELFCKVGRIQYIVLAPILFGFVFFGKAFIFFWAGNGYEYSYVITLLLIVPFTIALIQTLGVEIQRAMNLHWIRSIVYLVVAIVNVIISIPCIKTWGLKGAALGTALTFIAGSGLFMNWFYYKIIGLDIFQFWKQIIKLTIAMSPCIILGIFVQFIKMEKVGVFVFWGGIFVIIYLISMYLWGLNSYEKSLIRKLFVKMRRK